MPVPAAEPLPLSPSRTEPFALTERLHRSGPAALSDDELLALVLGGRDAKLEDGLRLSAALLENFGDLRRVLCASVTELVHVRGVGPVRAARLLAAAELGRRAVVQPLTDGETLSGSRAVFEHFAPLLVHERREVFLAVLLDMKNRVLRSTAVSVGSLGASLVHPREAFLPAIRESAAAVVFVHNHPSGEPEPSVEDRRITERLRAAGELLGIPVLDHIILGLTRYYSFADQGW